MLALSGNIGLATTVIDAAVDPASVSLKLAKAWSAYAGFKHFWTPQIWTAITGGYISVNNRPSWVRLLIGMLRLSSVLLDIRRFPTC
ncbi:MAG: hypothetical protein R3D02_05885 [Hyphomicrobiales bacterium]